MRPQICKVRNKSQLIVAFGCAIDYPGPTEITLTRKDGKISEYCLDPLAFYKKRGYQEIMDHVMARDFNKSIKKAISKIRKIPATMLK